MLGNGHQTTRILANEGMPIEQMLDTLTRSWETKALPNSTLLSFVGYEVGLLGATFALTVFAMSAAHARKDDLLAELIGADTWLRATRGMIAGIALGTLLFALMIDLGSTPIGPLLGAAGLGVSCMGSLAAFNRALAYHKPRFFVSRVQQEWVHEVVKWRITNTLLVRAPWPLRSLATAAFYVVAPQRLHERHLDDAWSAIKLKAEPLLTLLAGRARTSAAAKAEEATTKYVAAIFTLYRHLLFLAVEACAAAQKSLAETADAESENISEARARLSSDADELGRRINRDLYAMSYASAQCCEECILASIADGRSEQLACLLDEYRRVVKEWHYARREGAIPDSDGTLDWPRATWSVVGVASPITPVYESLYRLLHHADTAPAQGHARRLLRDAILQIRTYSMPLSAATHANWLCATALAVVGGTLTYARNLPDAELWIDELRWERGAGTYALSSSERRTLDRIEVDRLWTPLGELYATAQPQWPARQRLIEQQLLALGASSQRGGE